MSIWSSLMSVNLSGYRDEHPSDVDMLDVDVAYSSMSPLIRIAAWSPVNDPRPFDVEFYVSQQQAEELIDALTTAVRAAKVASA